MRSLLLGLLVLAAPALPAQDRALRWPDITVTAHLDADGRLSVRERQTILLSGDWNGPERTFSIPFGQRVTLTALTRQDPATGADIPLREGDLDVVDGFDWTDRHTLRWRSRLPSDPPHDSTTLIYTLDLLYEFVLQPDGDGRYRLAHDFAFADRYDNIDRFALTLTFDDAWEVAGELPREFRAGPLPPGDGFVVTVGLTRRDGAAPASLVHGASPTVRVAAAAVLGLAAVVLVPLFFAREAGSGRFAATPDPDSITREWLERHVLSIPPELVGTAWDDTTAAAEVAATIARMIADKQLASTVREEQVWRFRRTTLELLLLVPRHTLAAHDRILIDALFEPGRDRTDTDAVRTRYKSTGFDPARLLQPGLRQRLDAATGLGGTIPAPSRWPSVLLLFAALGCFFAGVSQQPTDVIALPAAGAILLGYGIVGLQAGFLQSRVVDTRRALVLRLFLPAIIGIAVLAVVMVTKLTLASPWAIASLTLFALAGFNSACNLARTRHDATRIAVRQRLAAARERFRRELRSPQPALRDAWYPWVIAFGLGSVADRWFRAFGGAQRSAGHSQTSGGGFSGSGSSGSGWSGFGGGGGFSGAGSSGAFAAAIGGMAATVPSPSSSSSGGSSGGGSSGGGGGGGW